MATILNTVLATSQPLSIIYGFEMFPQGSGPFWPSYQRNGIFLHEVLVDSDTSIPIIDLGIVGVSFDVGVHIYFDLAIGMAGPAIALMAAVEGETFDGTRDANGNPVPNTGTAVCEFTNGGAQAGIGFGAALGFTFKFDLGLDIWYDVWVASGSYQIFGISFSVNINIDLLGGVIKAIEVGMQAINKSRKGSSGSSEEHGSFKYEEHFQSLSPLDPQPPGFFDTVETAGVWSNPDNLAGQVWGIFDQCSDPGAIDGGVLYLEPTLLVQIDVCPYIPFINEVAEMLDVVGGTLATGPEFGVGFPITINVYQLYVDANDPYPYNPANTISTSAYTNATVLSADDDAYQQLLAAAAYAAYQANGAAIPSLPDLLAIAGRAVQLGTFPNTTAYLTSLISNAGGTVPPDPANGQQGNTIGFSGGPNPAVKTINNVTVEFQHQVGLTVTFGWFFNLDVLGLSLDAAIDITVPVGSWWPGGISGVKVDAIQNANGGQFVVNPQATSGLDASSRVAIEEATERVSRRFVDVVFETVPS